MYIGEKLWSNLLQAKTFFIVSKTWHAYTVISDVVFTVELYALMSEEEAGCNHVRNLFLWCLGFSINSLPDPLF